MIFMNERFFKKKLRKLSKAPPVLPAGCLRVPMTTMTDVMIPKRENVRRLLRNLSLKLFQSGAKSNPS